MKKLAIIGATAVAIAAPLAMAHKAMAMPADPPSAGIHTLMLHKTGVTPYANTSSAPVGFTRAEYKALLIRSEGMNQKYGIGRKASQVPPGFTKDEYQALMLRSKGLNEKYGIGGIQSTNLELGDQQRFATNNPLHNGEPTPATSNDSSGVQWDTVGISMAALLGFVALIGTAVLGVRHRGHLRTS